MNDWLLLLLPLALAVGVWVWERWLRDERPSPSFRPWTVRLKPKQKK